MKLFTIWFNPVKPNQAHRFLVHLLPSCGCFIDECDLFGRGSLRQSFVKGRLLNEDRIEESITKLMKMRFVNQLIQHLPSGTPTFDHHCAAAFSTIAPFFRDDAMHTDETPCVLCNRLKRNTESENPHEPGFEPTFAVIESVLVLLSPKWTLTNCAKNAMSHNRCSPAGSLFLVNRTGIGTHTCLL